MNLVQLASHTVDLDLLPERPWVLDVGCRGFDFAEGVRQHRPRAMIVCLDPSGEVAAHPRSEFIYFQTALVADPTLEDVDLETWSDGVGDFVRMTAPRWYFQQAIAHRGRTLRVPAVEITALTLRLSQLHHVAMHWDLVKLDCEASEFSILENWPSIATQISVEFHDFADRGRWNGAYFAALFRKLSDYQVVQHEDSLVSDNRMGHWDSLLILRDRL
jgi:hypothetical protein